MSELLQHVFGIASFSAVIKLELKNLEQFIQENAEELLGEGSFAVRARRTGSHDFTSQELGARLGEIVIDEIGRKVDLTNPDAELFVEVRNQDAYIFTRKIAGPGGMPLGSQGKVICFVDSHEALVACWLMMKRGCVPDVYYTGSCGDSVDVLDNWSYGNRLKKIRVKSVNDVDSSCPLVVGDSLEKGGVKKYDGKFVLTPVVGFKKEEIEGFWGKINNIPEEQRVN